MDIADIFGIKLSPRQEAERQADRDAEIERLRIELQDAKDEINNLRRALGSNHRLTMSNAIF